ncbi:MAG: hypothetical protein FWG44_03145 [Oscillospiraceae bacterium]|nr:hypothetical protein [Oscillospiraceae bacterium]
MAENQRNLSVNFAAKTTEFTKGTLEIKQALTELNAKNDEVKLKIKEVNSEIKNYEKQQKELQEAIASGINSKELQNNLEEVNKKLKSSKEHLAELKTEQQLLKPQIAGANQMLKEQYKNLSDVGDSAIKTGDIIKAHLISEAIISGLKQLSEGFKSIILDSAQAADDINTMANTYGLSTEEIQKFQYATRLIDVSIDTLTKTMARNIRSMSDYQSGVKEKIEAYDRLGVSIITVNGELRDSHTVYNEVIDALGRMANETERDALAMQLLGRSAQELNPLIKGGAEALRELGEQADRLGLILTQEQLDNLHEFNDKIDTTKANFKALSMQVAEEFAKSFDSAFDAGEDFVNFIMQLKDDGTLAGMAQDLAAAVKFVIGALQNGMTIIFKFKDEIIAITKAFIAFKVSMSIGSAIASVVMAIKQLKTANDAATVSQIALNTAMKANPYALVASLAISAAIGIGSYIISANNAVKVTAEMAEASRQKAESSRQEYESLKNLADEYEKIGKKTNHTGEEKDRLIQIQDILNQKYLSEADNLDLLNGKYTENINKIKEYSDEFFSIAKYEAIQALNDAKDLYETLEKQGIFKDEGVNLRNAALNLMREVTKDKTLEEQAEALQIYIESLIESGKERSVFFEIATNEYIKLTDVINNLENAEKNYNLIIDETTKKTKDSTNTFDDQSKSIDETSSSIKTHTEILKDNQKAVNDLSSESKKLSSAFAEMNENGNLAVDTYLSLIDSGYALALEIDNETGLVKLNAEAYKELAKAKLEAQRADYAAQRSELEIEFGRMTGYRPSNLDENDPYFTRTYELSEQLRTLNLQESAINQLINNLDNVVTGEYGAKAASGGRGASNAEAEERARLAAYQTGLEKAAKERIGWISDEQKALKAKHDAEIAAINEEVKRRKEMRADDEHQNKIDQINARLRYEQMDEFSRLQLEAEKARLELQREDVLFERDIEAQKDELSKKYQINTETLSQRVDEINNALASFKNAITTMNTPAVQNAIQQNAYNNYSNNPQIYITANQMTESQIMNMIKQEMSRLYQ